MDQLSVSIPIVLSDQEGKVIADVSMYTAWTNRTLYKLSAPPKYVYLEPTDLVTVNFNGEDHTMRIISSTFAHPGIINIEAVAEDPSTYDFYIEPGLTPGAEDSGSTVPDSQMEILDLPAFPSDTDDIGKIRFAVAGDGEGWIGAGIFRSDDGGENVGNTFTQMNGVDSEAVIGKTINALSSGPRNHYDMESELEIALLNGELALLNGANSAVVGNEILQFQNVELVAQGRYKLTKLLRGRLLIQRHCV